MIQERSRKDESRWNYVTYKEEHKEGPPKEEKIKLLQQPRNRTLTRTK